MKILIKESQLKSFIKNKLGVDLTDRIHIVTNKLQLPMELSAVIHSNFFNSYLNMYGPMFIIKTKNNMYLAQDRGKDRGWFVADKNDRIVDETEVMSELGVGQLGLSMNDLISMYF